MTQTAEVCIGIIEHKQQVKDTLMQVASFFFLLLFNRFYQYSRCCLLKICFSDLQDFVDQGFRTNGVCFISFGFTGSKG